VLAWILGREAAIIVVIALLVLGGSQLPKLVRALGEASAGPKKADDDAAEPERRFRSPGT
jgi:Sec-independent protein translocase protein TatA